MVTKMSGLNPDFLGEATQLQQEEETFSLPPISAEILWQ